MATYNKWKSIKTEYNGVIYPSKLEAKVALLLDEAKARGKVKKIERQIKLPMRIAGKKICDYVVDFRVTFKDKTIEYVEAKGVETDVFKLKARMYRVLYPYKLHIVMSCDIMAFVQYLDKRTEKNIQYLHESKRKQRKGKGKIQKVHNASDFLV